MQSWRDAKMQRYKNAKMQRCKDEKLLTSRRLKGHQSLPAVMQWRVWQEQWLTIQNGGMWQKKFKKYNVLKSFEAIGCVHWVHYNFFAAVSLVSNFKPLRRSKSSDFNFSTSTYLADFKGQVEFQFRKQKRVTIGNTKWNQTKKEILNRKETLAGHCYGKNLDEGAQNLQSVSGGGDAVSLPVSPDEGDFVVKGRVKGGMRLVIWMLILTFAALFSGPMPRSQLVSWMAIF